MVCDLVHRLASRGMMPPAVDDIGRDCGPGGPVQLKGEGGSDLVRGQMQGFLAAVLRGRTVPELREVCSLAGLPTCGAKADLVRRLAYQRDIEPSTPKKQARGFPGLESEQANQFSTIGIMSPKRLAQPHQCCKAEESLDWSESLCVGREPIKKVMRRRSVGTPPSVDIVHSDFVSPSKSDGSTVKRRRMSI